MVLGNRESSLTKAFMFQVLPKQDKHSLDCGIHAAYTLKYVAREDPDASSQGLDVGKSVKFMQTWVEDRLY